MLKKSIPDVQALSPTKLSPSKNVSFAHEFPLLSTNVSPPALIRITSASVELGGIELETKVGDCVGMAIGAVGFGTSTTSMADMNGSLTTDTNSIVALLSVTRTCLVRTKAVNAPACA